MDFLDMFLELLPNGRKLFLYATIYYLFSTNNLGQLANSFLVGGLFIAEGGKPNGTLSYIFM